MRASANVHTYASLFFFFAGELRCIGGTPHFAPAYVRNSSPCPARQVCVCVYMCIYVRVCVCTYIHLHTHKHAHTQALRSSLTRNPKCRHGTGGVRGGARLQGTPNICGSTRGADEDVTGGPPRVPHHAPRRRLLRCLVRPKPKPILNLNPLNHHAFHTTTTRSTPCTTPSPPPLPCAS
jgi:hypothetical protein